MTTSLVFKWPLLRFLIKSKQKRHEAQHMNILRSYIADVDVQMYKL
jgi:hypothetical protein